MEDIDYSKFEGHMPGPWEFDHNFVGIHKKPRGNGMNMLAAVCFHLESSNATAYLMAAAPELLARCQELAAANEKLTNDYEVAQKRADELQGGHLDLIAENEKLSALTERLKQEAEIHAQEARTLKATVQECYIAATGETGEPGDWNGAKPVKKRISDLEAENESLRDNLKLNASAIGLYNLFAKNSENSISTLKARVAELEEAAKIQECINIQTPCCECEFTGHCETENKRKGN